MQSGRRPSLSLIIPVLNVEPRLEEVLQQISSTIDEPRPEIIVVCDVTGPELLPAVREEQARLERSYGIHTITRTAERGFGSALRAGFMASSGDVVIPIMGDASDDIAVIPRMLDRVQAGAHIVAGSRYMPGGCIIGDTPKQQFSRWYSKIMRAVSTIRCDDVSNSFKAYRREVWGSVQSHAHSFDISVEMTVKGAARGFRVDQVPSTWTNRRAGKSSFGMLREFPHYLRWLTYAAVRLPSPRALVALPVALVSLLFIVRGAARAGRR